MNWLIKKRKNDKTRQYYADFKKDFWNRMEKLPIDELKKIRKNVVQELWGVALVVEYGGKYVNIREYERITEKVIKIHILGKLIQLKGGKRA